MITIGITGTIGAGKGVVVEYLKTKGFIHYSARNFIIQEMQKRRLEPIRDNMNTVANDLRKTFFPGYIISELLNQAKKNGTNAVIESVRSMGELELLRKDAENFYLLAINADPKTRYERIVRRGSSTDHITFEKFVDDERKELVSTEVWNMNINQCMAHADFTIENDGPINELYAKVEEFLKRPQNKL